MNTRDRRIELVRRLLPLSPAGADYVRRRADPSGMQSRHLRSLQASLRRESRYLPGGAREDAEGVLRQVELELRSRKAPGGRGREDLAGGRR